MRDWGGEEQVYSKDAPHLDPSLLLNSFFSFSLTNCCCGGGSREEGDAEERARGVPRGRTNRRGEGTALGRGLGKC